MWFTDATIQVPLANTQNVQFFFFSSLRYYMIRRNDYKPLTSRKCRNRLFREKNFFFFGIANNGSPTTPLRNSTKL